MLEIIVAVLISIIPFLIWHLEKWCKRSGQRGKVKRKGEVYIRYGNSQDKQRLKKFEIFEKTCKIFRYLILVIGLMGIVSNSRLLVLIGISLFMTSAKTIFVLDALMKYAPKTEKMVYVIITYAFLPFWLWTI